MVKLQFHSKYTIRVFVLMAVLGLVSACVQKTGGKRKIKDGVKAIEEGGANGNNQNNLGPGSGRYDPTNINQNTSTDLYKNGRPELRFLAHPQTGSFKNKLTIPKNFSGHLYLVGINIASLKDRIVYVRFKFGREMEPVTVPATIARTDGLTPQTDLEVLVLDMINRPFQNVRLPYDLWDYNSYWNGANETNTPIISDPFDDKLYCRGLKLDHDPTFEMTATNTKCDLKAADADTTNTDTNEDCRYAYAKVVDAGLYYTDTSISGNPVISYTPILPQLDLDGNGYTSDSSANALKKCLPDNLDSTNITNVLNATSVTASYGGTVTVGGTNYIYRGPFRFIDQSNWEISGDALISNSTNYYGLFTNVDTTSTSIYYTSYLFPRAGKLSLKSGVEHFSSSTPFTTRSSIKLSVSGETNYMNGCSVRATNYDSYNNEGIGSCNVTATIELVVKDDKTGVESVVPLGLTGNTNGNTKIKLQIVRAGQKNSQGKEVLYSALKSCKSDQACGSSECCYNNRCWSKDIVSQCLSSSTNLGLGSIGTTCKNDFDCASLCCNRLTGTCAVHKKTSTEEVLCSKAPGDQCVAKEWCKKENVNHCYVVITAVDPLGNKQCALRCYNIPTHGDCVDGICAPAVAPTPMPFDPANPDCSQAVWPPKVIQTNQSN